MWSWNNFVTCREITDSREHRLRAAGADRARFSGIMLFADALIHYHTMPYFDALNVYIAVENIVRKGEIVVTSNFSFLTQCFLPSTALIFILNAL